MTEDKKKNIIKNHILKIETDENPFYDVKILISNIQYHVRQAGKSSIEISYLLKISSKLDSKWSLDKHKTLKLVGTFESIFIKHARTEKLKQLGI